MTSEILVIGRNKENLITTLQSINKIPGWYARGAMQDEEAIELFHSRSFDLVVFTDVIEKEAESKLRSVFSFRNPEISIIQHTSGNTGLLNNAIRETIDKRKYLHWKTISVSDTGIQ